MIRSDEEFRNEVFRRSDKYIRQKKKERKRRLMICTPIVLCLVVFGFSVLSGESPGGKKDSVGGSMESARNEGEPSENNQTLEIKQTQYHIDIEIRIAGSVSASYGIGEQEKYQELCGMLDDLVENGKEITDNAASPDKLQGQEEENENQPETAEPETVPTDIPDSDEDTVYRIELTDESGYVTVYELYESGECVLSDGRVLEAEGVDVRKVLEWIKELQSGSGN